MPTQPSPPKPRDLLPEAEEGTHWVAAFGELGDNEYFCTVTFGGMRFKYKLVKDGCDDPIVQPIKKTIPCHAGTNLSAGGHGYYTIPGGFCPKCGYGCQECKEHERRLL